MPSGRGSSGRSGSHSSGGGGSSFSGGSSGGHSSYAMAFMGFANVVPLP